MSKYIIIVLFCMSSSFAQNINQYKYVEVPQRFDFQKEANAFNVNVLTKMLLEKYGFITYMDDALKPADAANDICKEVLHVKVDEESTLFVRKLTVKLLDCQNNIVFTTKQGESSTKDLRVAYNQALRMAFESFDSLSYKYEQKASNKSVNAAANHSTEALQINRSTNPGKIIVNEDNLAKVTQRTIDDASAKVESATVEIEFVAKSIENGFLLQSATLPEIRMQKSSIDNYYIAQIGDLPAMIYKIGSVWKLEYYKNAKLQSKVIDIKF